MITFDLDVGTWLSDTQWTDDDEPLTGLLVIVGTLNGEPRQVGVSVALPNPPTGHETVWGRFEW